MTPPTGLATLPRVARAQLEGDWIDPACALCGSRARRTRFVEPPYTVVACARCGLVYVTPRRTSGALLREVYAEDYWRSPVPRERGYGDYLGDEQLYLATFARRFDLLGGFLGAPGRALDVGCAAGFALRVLRERGWQVCGLEPSSAARAAACARLGAECVVPHTLETAQYAPASFELVMLWDVLEHLPDPIAGLRRARELLTGDGRLVIETQNVRSRAARLLGRRWQHYKHAEHLHHFSPATLQRALEASGLEPIACRPRGGGKYVSREFLLERSARLWPRLPRLMAPLACALPRAMWVDLGDELLVVARPRQTAS